MELNIYYYAKLFAVCVAALPDFDNLLLDHVGLHQVVIVTIPLVFLCWMGKGDHPKTFLLKALYCQSTPSWLKVWGWVALGIILSSPGTGGTLYSHFPGPKSQVPVA